MFAVAGNAFSEEANPASSADFTSSLLQSIPSISKKEIQTLRGYPPRPEKKNRNFYGKYLERFAKAIRESPLTSREKINLYSFLVVETHRRNGIGYVWGGDMLDLDPDPTSKGGVGYDCSGYVWSVYQAILPAHPFTNSKIRLNARDYLPLGKEIIPLSTVDQEFAKQTLRRAKPGDLMIDPSGHICIYGKHPVSGEEIVMENGYEWATLEKWGEEKAGKTYCIRSGFEAEVEATSGFEPENGGFADLSLSHLGTSP